jgi:hypothetical protein
MNGEGPNTAPATGGSVLTDPSPPAPGKETTPALARRIDRAVPSPVGVPVRAPMARGTIAAVVSLGMVLVGIIGVAFRGSWTAHRDAALAAHFDPTGAVLYPFAPDGLIVIALIAAMVLRHDRRARFYALSVVGLFTFTSFVINHLHGLGQFALIPATGLRPDLPWPTVALIAGQVIGAMFFGSHLIVFALRYLFPGTPSDQPGQAVAAPVEHRDGDAETPHVPAIETVLEPEPEDIAKRVYSVLLDLDQPIGRDKLAKVCGISARAAVRVRKEVEQEHEEAELAREEEERLAAERKIAEDAELVARAQDLKPQDVGQQSPNGSGPRPEPVTSNTK